MLKPLVSIGIPLYQSKEWLEVICENIHSQDYPNIEFLISDRHCLDDTILQLQKKFTTSNFKFFIDTDQANWVTNCNELLRKANGKYFMWMPHDDSFSSNYISSLVHLLESNDKTILALGVINQVAYPENKLIRQISFSATQYRKNSFLFILYLAIGIIKTNGYWHLFRGLYKTDLIRNKNIFLSNGSVAAGADLFWGLSILLTGEVVVSKDCYTNKRIYARSTSYQWSKNLFEGIRGRFRIFNLHLKTFKKAEKNIFLRFFFSGLLSIDFMAKCFWDFIKKVFPLKSRKKIAMLINGEKKYNIATPSASADHNPTISQPRNI